MERVRSARGQSAAEYVGVIAFVGLLVLAVIGFTPGVGERATGSVRAAYCKVTSALVASSCSDGRGGDGPRATDQPGAQGEPGDTAGVPGETGGPGGTADGSDSDGGDTDGGDGGNGSGDDQSPRDRAEAGTYVALGDSYSSGEGADDYLDGTDTDDNRCHRSGNAYSQVVHGGGNFGGPLVFGACSGAVADDYFDANTGQDGESAQQAHLNDDTSLVTVSMGGNDFGFVDVLTTCVTGLKSCARDKHDQEVRDRIAAELPQLVQMYLDMRERAPGARILVVGYPHLFPHEASGEWSLSGTISGKERRWMNEIGAHANAQIQAAIAEANAQGANIEYVDVSHALDGHEIGSDDPWMNDLTVSWGLPPSVSPASFHPNAEGQAAIAEAVNAQIDKGP